ncbi:patatin-like phospholipase family protein, partial [Vibrio anguillarum]
ESNWREVLIATCAIPRLYPHEVKLGDDLYIDGGVSASIPVQEAWRRGARFVAVIRTECPDVDAVESGLPMKPLPSVKPYNEAHWLHEPLQNIQGQWR